MSNAAPFAIASLNTTLHQRDAFDCGAQVLNHYLKKQVSQDMRRHVAACFVALTDTSRIAGYYTLAASSLFLGDLPIEIGKKLPRYPTVPAVLMGRLAVDQAFKGQGLGGALLGNALERAARSEIAAYALMVHAKDKEAAAFYRHHGFIELPDKAFTLFLPLATVKSHVNDVLK